jgi:glyoxylate reductase
MKILVTRPIPSEGIALLRAAKFTLDIYNKDQVMPRKELLKRAKGVDGILSLLNDKVDVELMNAAGPQLKIIANYAVGFDNVDLPAAKKRNIVVTNTPAPEVSETVAEHTIALMFALGHRICESDAFARAGKYKAWGPQLLLGTAIMGKTIGIIGTGRVGEAVVKRLYDGFGVRIIYSDLKQNERIEKEEQAKHMEIDALLREADFVSLHVPLLPSTRHLINARRLKLMKKTAFLINTSRGPIVDEKALIAALQKKQIAGAGIDVFEFEPTIPKAMRKLRNVVITPHTASATIEARQAMSRFAAQNLIAVLSGKPPLNPAK